MRGEATEHLTAAARHVIEAILAVLAYEREKLGLKSLSSHLNSPPEDIGGLLEEILSWPTPPLTASVSEFREARGAALVELGEKLNIEAVVRDLDTEAQSEAITYLHVVLGRAKAAYLSTTEENGSEGPDDFRKQWDSD